LEGDRIPDEEALAGPEHLDRAYVAAYERKAQFDPSADLEDLVARGLGPGSTLVDLGAGTGALAVEAAAACERVVAVDVSPAMAEAIRAKALDRGVTNLTAVQAGFLSYRHAGRPADFVYTRNALHHLPDIWKAVALQRVADVLRPGGVLRLRDLALSFDPSEMDERLAAWVAGGADDPALGWTPAELETHIREEFSTFTWLLEPMLERAGFEIVDADFAPSGMYAAYVCSKPV